LSYERWSQQYRAVSVVTVRVDGASVAYSGDRSV